MTEMDIADVELTPRKSVSEREVKEFEGRHNVELPKEYRDFMLAVNGGSLVPMVVLRGTNVSLHEFYSLNDRHPYDLDKMCISLDWEEAYENGYLVIGRDVGGSRFIVSTRGKDCGAIYFLDAQAYVGEDYVGEPVKVARSLHDFIRQFEADSGV